MMMNRLGGLVLSILGLGFVSPCIVIEVLDGIPVFLFFLPVTLGAPLLGILHLLVPGRLPGRPVQHLQIGIARYHRGPNKRTSAEGLRY